MKPEALKKTIDSFLSLINKGAESVQQTEQLLRIYLVRIALASSELGSLGSGIDNLSFII
ncbi:MAG: hypothetical protein VB050_13040 [Geobacteraceae bacterium]|nr:hypothetical protein [Geobacteraceae bacterium]